MPTFATFAPFIPLLAISGLGFVISAGVLFGSVVCCRRGYRRERASRAAAAFALFALFFWSVASAFVVLTWPVEPEQAYLARLLPPDTATDTALWEVAVSRGIYVGGLYRALPTNDDDGQCDLDILSSQFNSVTPEKALTMDELVGDDGEYMFDDADYVVSWATKRGLRVRGHALVCDTHVPAPFRRKVEGAKEKRREATAILKSHISRVVGRYRGRIKSWDVVNEPMCGGEWGDRRNTFYGAGELGVDYIEVALRAAHEADPSATLLINEAFTDGYDPGNPKIVGFLALLDHLLERGAPLHGVGIQARGVFRLDDPQDDGALGLMRELEARGLLLEVTEFDARLRLFSDAYPGENAYVKQGEYYAAWMGACLQVSACRGFTTWGVTDGSAWYEWQYLFRWMRANEPLMWDTQKRAKPAYTDTVRALRSYSGPPHADPSSFPARQPLNAVNGEQGSISADDDNTTTACTDFRRVSKGTWVVLGLIFYSGLFAIALSLLFYCVVRRRSWDRLDDEHQQTRRVDDTTAEAEPDAAGVDAGSAGGAVSECQTDELTPNDVELTTRGDEASRTL